MILAAATSEIAQCCGSPTSISQKWTGLDPRSCLWRFNYSWEEKRTYYLADWWCSVGNMHCPLSDRHCPVTTIAPLPTRKVAVGNGCMHCPSAEIAHQQMVRLPSSRKACLVVGNGCMHCPPADRPLSPKTLPQAALPSQAEAENSTVHRNSELEADEWMVTLEHTCSLYSSLHKKVYVNNKTRPKY